MTCPHGNTNRKACSKCVSADDDAEIATLREKLKNLTADIGCVRIERDAAEKEVERWKESDSEQRRLYILTGDRLGDAEREREAAEKERDERCGQVEHYQQREDEIMVALGSCGIPSDIVPTIENLKRSEELLHSERDTIRGLLGEARQLCVEVVTEFPDPQAEFPTWATRAHRLWAQIDKVLPAPAAPETSVDPRLNRAWEAVSWMSAAADFDPEGRARKGFEKVVVPVLREMLPPNAGIILEEQCEPPIDRGIQPGDLHPCCFCGEMIDFYKAHRCPEPPAEEEQ